MSIRSPNSLTLETKSLLASLYKREELPLFGKEGLGEIFRKICLLNYGLFRNSERLRDRRIDLHTPPPLVGRVGHPAH
jgi:hypothetical protein